MIEKKKKKSNYMKDELSVKVTSKENNKIRTKATPKNERLTEDVSLHHHR